MKAPVLSEAPYKVESLDAGFLDFYRYEIYFKGGPLGMKFSKSKDALSLAAAMNGAYLLGTVDGLKLAKQQLEESRRET